MYFTCIMMAYYVFFKDAMEELIFFTPFKLDTNFVDTDVSI